MITTLLFSLYRFNWCYYISAIYKNERCKAVDCKSFWNIFQKISDFCRTTTFDPMIISIKFSHRAFIQNLKHGKFWVLKSTSKLQNFISRTSTRSFAMGFFRLAWFKLNRLLNGIRWFRFSIKKRILFFYWFPSATS